MDKNSYNINFKVSDIKPDGKKVFRWILIAVAVALLILLIVSSVYTVGDKEQAVITTFGKVTGISEPGIHVKLPFGIQNVETVKVNEIKNIEIGYRSDGSNNNAVKSESKMITGDFNIVNVDFFIEYRISDPVKYLYASSYPDEILKMLIQSQIRNVIGSYEIDPVLTESKEQIQSDILALTIEELEKYDIGLSLITVRIQDSEPPTSEVNEAFMAVKNADSGAKTAINNANAYKNTEEAKADAEVNKILQNAEYLKQQRINEAEQEVAMFNAMIAEYIKNPGITKSRMYYEAIESVFPGVTVYIDASDGSGITKLLPLGELLGGKSE